MKSSRLWNLPFHRFYYITWIISAKPIDEPESITIHLTQCHCSDGFTMGAMECPFHGTYCSNVVYVTSTVQILESVRVSVALILLTQKIWFKNYFNFVSVCSRDCVLTQTSIVPLALSQEASAGASGHTSSRLRVQAPGRGGQPFWSPRCLPHLSSPHLSSPHLSGAPSPLQDPDLDPPINPRPRPHCLSPPISVPITPTATSPWPCFNSAINPHLPQGPDTGGRVQTSHQTPVNQISDQISYTVMLAKL